MTDIYRQNEHQVRRQISSAITTAEAAIDAVEALVGLSASPTTTKLVATLDRIIADTTIANTTTETTLYTKTVDHADFNGYALRLTIAGTYLNNSGGLEAPTCRIKFGTTTIATIALSYAAGASVRQWRIELELTSRSTSAQECTGVNWFSAASGAVSNPAVAQSAMFNGTAAESTSGAGTKALTVTWQHQAAAATISIALKTGLLERI